MSIEESKFLKEIDAFPSVDHDDHVDVFYPKMRKKESILGTLWLFIWPSLVQGLFCSAVSVLLFPHSALGFILLILGTSFLMHWFILPRIIKKRYR